MSLDSTVIYARHASHALETRAIHVLIVCIRNMLCSYNIYPYPRLQGDETGGLKRADICYRVLWVMVQQKEIFSYCVPSLIGFQTNCLLTYLPTIINNKSR